MPWGRKRRCIAVGCAALAFASPIVAPSAAGAQTPPAAEVWDPATIAPVDTPTIDPVLDAVEVDTTPAIRRADDALEASVRAQTEAALRWIEAERRRAEMQARAGTAADRAAAAQQAVVDALVDEGRQRDELDRRRSIERQARRLLATEQDVLRTIAASLFARAPDDAYAVLGTLDDITRADRRDTMQDRGVALQSDRVDAATSPWEAARAERRRQERRLAAATKARTDAAADAIAAADERDRFAELLHVLETRAAAAAGDLTAEQRASKAVLVERRTARLGSTVTDLDLPLVALDAYWRASALAPCTVPWWLLAGIGRAETRHGTAYGSTLTPEGDTTVPILGIPLDGRPGTLAIADTDGGRLDRDGTWDRAVGPMQFIPGTWGRWARDGNADETADPHNVYDAASAAAAYLCFRRSDLGDEAQQRQALLSYNRSVPYGTQVLANGHRYRDALDLPDEAPRPTPQQGSPEGQ